MIFFYFIKLFSSSSNVSFISVFRTIFFIILCCKKNTTSWERRGENLLSFLRAWNILWLSTMAIKNSREYFKLLFFFAFIWNFVFCEEFNFLRIQEFSLYIILCIILQGWNKEWKVFAHFFSAWCWVKLISLNFTAFIYTKMKGKNFFSRTISEAFWLLVSPWEKSRLFTSLIRMMGAHMWDSFILFLYMWWIVKLKQVLFFCYKFNC